MRNLWTAVPIAVASLAFGLTTTSCGGGGSTATNPDLVLLGFNQPNVAGVALNQPLVFTFSADVDPLSITPDTLRVVGATGPFFELTHVDGNLVGLLPRTPNFDDYTDVGLFPNTQYNVSMPTFPAVDTIESTAGKPLLSASTFTFRTTPTPVFIEARRALQHGIPPIQGGRSDDEGCLQNPENELFINPYAPGSTDPLPQQTNSGPGGRLLCLLNEGPPHILRNASSPTHDQRAVGTPAAGSQNIGKVSLPAVRIVFNEFLDPPTVTPYPSTQLPTNVQLWRVGHLDGSPVNPPEAIQVNKPLIVQSLEGIEVILVASDAVLQGIYMVNVTANVKDLAQNRLVITDRPNLTGTVYANLDAALGPAVPQGYRYFFQTLQIAGAASAINESFGTNIAEWGDVASQLTEPGVFTQSTPATNPLTPMPATVPAPMTTDAFTLLFGNAAPQPTAAPPQHFGTLSSSLLCGQTTTANWNNGFRFLNIPSLEANTDADGGLGVLKATWRPYCGVGGDGIFDSDAAPFNPGPGDGISLNTTPGLGASVNSDGVFEYESFFLRAGDTMTITGTKPCVILVRGNFEVDGTIDLSGAPGGFGIDTDGSTLYTNAGAIQTWGQGGTGGPGAGAGGRGAGPLVGQQQPGSVGGSPKDIWGNVIAGGGGGVANNLDPFSAGGGGGGHGTIGANGTRQDASAGGLGGSLLGTPLFERSVSNFQTSTTPFGPDRGYSPNAAMIGGAGGGGGGAEDDSGASETGNTTVENGDDGAGGGGGGGGGLWVIAGGTVRVGGTGVIRADGGVGGNTYNLANQNVNRGADQSGGATADDFVDGLIINAVPSGAGGPGGGGSGGSIVLIGEGGVSVQLLATISAQGGGGGEAGDPDHVGGDGGAGRILLMGIGGSAVTNLGFVTPAPSTFDWKPTIRSDSVGQSQWIDLFTPTVVFNPVVGGNPQTPFDTNNFDDLIAAGKTQGTGVADDFCCVWEFQGADTLTPLPTVGTPTSATGLTQWHSNASLCDGKRYVRYRFRFHVKATYTGHGLLATPMPSILDVTIPFTK